MSEPVIRATGLGKKYILGHRTADRLPTFRDTMARTARSGYEVLGKMLRGEPVIPGDRFDEFWALKNVEFEIQRGDVFGIIGQNGAGKSTLLKVLSRITELSEGRVASLLEVGTGFHPELTGRENIYLNGAILGMTQKEVRARFNSIVDFAQVERFLDTPVKRFSSGMYVRLAFAVAAHLEPDILVVDEVLAVGDMEFQDRCLGKMREIGKSGRTVLFVSHNLAAVRALCNRALLLDSGAVKVEGAASSVVDEYYRSAMELHDGIGVVRWQDPVRAPGGEGACLVEAGVAGSESGPIGTVRATETVEVWCIYRQLRRTPQARVVFEFFTERGDLAFAATDHQVRKTNGLTASPGTYESRCTIPAHLLNNGLYSIRMRVGVPGGELLVPGSFVVRFRVVGEGFGGTAMHEDWPGSLSPRLPWVVTKIQ